MKQVFAKDLSINHLDSLDFKQVVVQTNLPLTIFIYGKMEIIFV